MIYIITLFCISIYAQNPRNINLDKLLAETSSDGYQIVINEHDYIAFVNNELFQAPILDKVEIKEGYTLGDVSVKFYFICLSSSSQNVTVVRWLHYDSGKLYLIDSTDKEHPLEHFYITCKGSMDCYPRLFVTNSVYSWACRDYIGCSAEEDNCATSVSLID